MTAVETIQVINAIGTIVTPVMLAIVTVWGSVLLKRIDARGAENAIHLLETKEAIKKVETQTNSIKDELVAATRSDALQEGHAAGLAEGSGHLPCQTEDPPEMKRFAEKNH